MQAAPGDPLEAEAPEDNSSRIARAREERLDLKRRAREAAYRIKLDNQKSHRKARKEAKHEAGRAGATHCREGEEESRCT